MKTFSTFARSGATTAAFLLLLTLPGCTTTQPLEPGTIEMERERGFVDPRLGYNGGDPAVTRQFDRAWNMLLQGRTDEAGRRLRAIVQKHPDYGPALVALARDAFQFGDHATAIRLADQARALQPNYLAAEIYRAEFAMAENDRRMALAIYRAIATHPSASATVQTRIDQLQKDLFDDLFAKASTQTPEIAVSTLREALAIAESSSARTILATHLVTLKRYDEARRELQALIDRGEAERPEVQSLLADIDVARGRYEDAIVRLERLARADSDRYATRLATVKQQWAEQNLPVQYRKAAESSAIDRGDLAVLIYWNVPAVRFATRVGAPPIAVDIAQVPGREELVRGLALGLFSVDPVTREVNPYATIGRASLARVLARVIALRGTPACGASAAGEPTELRRAEALLAACGVDLSLAATAPDEPVSGRSVVSLLQQVDRVLSAEKR
jgi:tetratricopeptide (TPR) repeat protein